MSGVVWPGLCARCRRTRVIESRTGSVFHFCGRSLEDPAFPRYPRLPVLECPGYEPTGGPGAVGEPEDAAGLTEEDRLAERAGLEDEDEPEGENELTDRDALPDGDDLPESGQFADDLGPDGTGTGRRRGTPEERPGGNRGRGPAVMLGP